MTDHRSRSASRRHLAFLLLMAGVFGGVERGAAQEAAYESGLYGGLGLGWGTLSYAGSSLGAIDWDNGAQIFLKLGYRIHGGLALAVRNSGWYGETANDTGVGVAALLAVAQVAPTWARGMSFTVGGGISSVSVPWNKPREEREEGLGTLFQVTYDLRLGEWFAITPYVGLLHSWLARDDSDLLHSGFGLTFW